MTDQNKEEKSIDNSRLLDIATEKVEEKNRLIINFLDLILIAVVFAFTLAVLWEQYQQMVAAIIYLAFMGIRFIRKFLILNKDSSTKGIKEYLQDRKEREIKIAYDKLLEMQNPAQQ